MPLADCVIDLLMDEWGYKYPDKVADRTNDVNQRVPCASPLQDHHLTQISPMFGTRPSSHQIVY